MHQTLQMIAKLFVAPWIFLFTLSGHPLQVDTVKPVPNYALDISHIKARLSTLESDKNLGASSILPTTVALFSTSLQSAISSSATTMTLVSSAFNNGASTLASSTYAFIIDEGTTQQEFVIADCTATICTNMQRGLSFLDGLTSVTSLQFSHRRGASVKITDAPILLLISNMMAGSQGLPNPIKYVTGTATTSFTSAYNLVDRDYVDSIAIAGASIVNASSGARGIVQLATGAQAGSTTAQGSSGAQLVIPASIGTTTCQSTGYHAVITDNNGFINQSCLGAIGLSNSTLSGTTTFTSTATSSIIVTATSSLKIGSSQAFDIGKHVKIFSTPGTTTWSVPPGLSLVQVEVIGAGGGGASAANGGSAGTWSEFAVGSANVITANGGGANSSGSQTAGTATGGDINISGGTGTTAASAQTAVGGSAAKYGPGGASSNGAATAGFGCGGNITPSGTTGNSGAGGGYALKMFDVSATTTIQLVVGTGGSPGLGVTGCNGAVVLTW